MQIAINVAVESNSHVDCPDSQAAKKKKEKIKRRCWKKWI